MSITTDIIAELETRFARVERQRDQAEADRRRFTQTIVEQQATINALRAARPCDLALRERLASLEDALKRTGDAWREASDGSLNATRRADALALECDDLREALNTYRASLQRAVGARDQWHRRYEALQRHYDGLLHTLGAPRL